MAPALTRARMAAEDLVAVLREHDLEGDALDEARRLARLLRRLERRSGPPSMSLVDGADDRLGGVVAACGVPALWFSYPVRRALTRLGSAWDDAVREADLAAEDRATNPGRRLTSVGGAGAAGPVLLARRTRARSSIRTPVQPTVREWSSTTGRAARSPGWQTRDSALAGGMTQR